MNWKRRLSTLTICVFYRRIILTTRNGTFGARKQNENYANLERTPPMTDTTIRRIVREVFNWTIFVLGCLILATFLGMLFVSIGHCQTAPCAGKTAKQQCACLGKDYDPNLKPLPGCVVRLPDAPEPQAKPPENIAPPLMLQEQHITTILPPTPPPNYKNYTLLEVPPNDWLQEYGHWRKLRWQDWSCYKVSYAIDGKGRQMFSCKLNRKITGKEK
jgi:hypothetical protein